MLKKEVLRSGLKAFIFDLDGVIIDSEPVHLQMTNEMLKERSLEMDWPTYETFIGKTDRAFFTFVKEFAKYEESVEELVLRNKASLDRYFREAKEVPVIPGVQALIKQLHKENYLLAIASSSSHVNIKHALRVTGLTDYFPIQVSGEDVTHGKPAPDIYLEAAKQLGVDPALAAAIEDSKAGAQSSSSAGLFTIGFQNASSGKQDLSVSDLIIHDMAELLA